MKEAISLQTNSALGKTFDWVFQQIRIAFRDLATNADFQGTTSDHEESVCRMVLCLKGDLKVCIIRGDQKKDFLVPAGSCSLHYQPDRCPCLECADHDRAQVLELACPANAFVQLLGGTRLGRELEEALNAGLPWHMHQPMSPAVQRTLVGLRDTVAETGITAAPLVLAKTLEMIWTVGRSSVVPCSRPISEDTRRAVEKARSILESNMAEPPTLETLAAEVGMSLSRLKVVFPRVCGMPPYAYLRQIRMERAWRLLSGNRLSVTETAMEVGYSNLSHFAKTFAAHYGVKPSKVLPNPQSNSEIPM